MTYCYTLSLKGAAQWRNGVAYRYIPLHAVTYRHIPSHTVTHTYRYIPLHDSKERLDGATSQAEAELKAAEEEAVAAKHAATASAARLNLKRDTVRLAADRLQARHTR